MINDSLEQCTIYDGIQSDIHRKLDSIETSQNESFKFLALLNFYSLQQNEMYARSLEGKLASSLEEITRLTEVAEFFQEEARLKNLRLAKSKGRKKKPRRDALYYEHLVFTLNLIINSSPKTRRTKSYDVLALILLYIFGLRVSNLLVLKQADLRRIKEYFSGAYTHGIKLPIIKSGRNPSKHVTFYPPPELVSLFEEYCEYVDFFCGGACEDIVFKNTCSGKPLDRSTFTNRLNKSLGRTGVFFDKVFTTHSFRIGFLSSIIQAEGGSLEAAKHLANHSKVSTTSLYNRKEYSSSEVRDLLKCAEAFRLNPYPDI